MGSYTSSLQHTNDEDAEEWAARCELAACHNLLAKHGLDDLFHTHASLRIPGTDSFLVTRFGVLFSQMRPEDLVRVSVPHDTPENEVGTLRNNTAFHIHAALQRAGHTAVIHTHTIAGNAVACAPDGLRPLTQKAMLVLPFTRYMEYGALATSNVEGDAMAAALQEEGKCTMDCPSEGDSGEDDDDDACSVPVTPRALILRHHGLLTVGNSIGEAFLWMEWIEKACQYDVAIGSRTSTPQHPTDESVAQTYAQGRQFLSPASPISFARPEFWTALLQTVVDHDGDVAPVSPSVVTVGTTMTHTGEPLPTDRNPSPS